MNGLIKTAYGPVLIFEKANQEAPYRLYNKHFKLKKHKTILNEFKEIIKKNYPDYTDKDIAELYSKLSESGCTYATMANAIINQFNGDESSFKRYFGDKFCNEDSSINNNKLMLDIFACVADMVELKITKYDSRNFDNYQEAATKILGIDVSSNIDAITKLNEAGWLADGLSEQGKLIFTNKRCATMEVYRGTPRELANELFGIDDMDMNIKKIEELLKKNNMEYSLGHLDVASKFSGLEVVCADNIKKWLQIYFDKNNIDLTMDAFSINKRDMKFNEMQTLVNSIVDSGYSVNVSPSVNKNVAMTDGKLFGWSTISNHAMNFEGFDSMGNILVCSWGKHHVIPKEYYTQLDFVAIKLRDKVKEFNRSV